MDAIIIIVVLLPILFAVVHHPPRFVNLHFIFPSFFVGIAFLDNFDSNKSNNKQKIKLLAYYY